MQTKLIALVKTLVLAGAVVATLSAGHGTTAQAPGLALSTPAAVSTTTVTPNDVPWGP